MWITDNERLALLAKYQRIIWLRQQEILAAGEIGLAKKAEVLDPLGIDKRLSYYLTEIITGKIILKSSKYEQIWKALNSL